MSWNVQRTPHVIKRRQTLALITYAKPANLHTNFFRHKARHDHKRLVAFHIFISTQTIAVFQNDVTKCPAAEHGLK